MKTTFSEYLLSFVILCNGFLSITEAETATVGPNNFYKAVICIADTAEFE